MRVNQQDIAEALGVSVITVSRAIRDHPDLAMATKRRILDKADELGYAKRRYVRRDTQPKEPVKATRSIGIILFEDDLVQEISPFESGVRQLILLQLQKECQACQATTILDISSHTEIPLPVKKGAIDSAFIFGRYTPGSLGWAKGMPVLAVSSYVKCPGLPRIVADNVGGMSTLTEHVISLGHQRILFLSWEDPLTMLHADRGGGYTLAMVNAGLEPRREVCPRRGEWSREQLLCALGGFTAVVCSSDSVATWLVETLGDRRDPDLSIASFDGVAGAARYDITTYEPDYRLMGRLAAQLLLNPAVSLGGTATVVTVPGQLMVRRSTRAPRHGQS